MPSVTSSPIRPYHFVRDLPRPATRPAKAGNQNNTANLRANPPVEEAVVRSAVLMVSAFVTDFPEESNETDDAAKLQEKYGGSVPQAKFTGPAKPPCGVTVKVTLAGLAKGTVMLVG